MVETLVLLVGVVCGLLSAGIASSKGRNQLGWLLLGFFLGPLGLLAAGLIENAETAARIRALQGYQDSLFTTCSNCGEVISTKAKSCRLCGISEQQKLDPLPEAEG